MRNKKVLARGKTIILITHSPELAEETERIITIKDGLITGERKGSGRDTLGAWG